MVKRSRFGFSLFGYPNRGLQHMKKFAALLVVLSLGLFTVGCPKPAEKPAEPAAPAAAEGQSEAAPAEGSGAAEAAPAEQAPAEQAPAETTPAEGSSANQ